ncbi:unnamed protein product, partial [Staurois parvus]
MMSGSDILFTTIHLITDWPIRGPVHSGHQIMVPRAPRECAQAANAGDV